MRWEGQLTIVHIFTDTGYHRCPKSHEGKRENHLRRDASFDTEENRPSRVMIEVAGTDLLSLAMHREYYIAKRKT
jgi:hypothetical protein